MQLDERTHRNCIHSSSHRMFTNRKLVLISNKCAQAMLESCLQQCSPGEHTPRAWRVQSERHMRAHGKRQNVSQAGPQGREGGPQSREAGPQNSNWVVLNTHACSRRVAHGSGRRQTEILIHVDSHTARLCSTYGACRQWQHICMKRHPREAPLNSQENSVMLQ